MTETHKGSNKILFDRFVANWTAVSGEYIPLASGTDLIAELSRFLSENGLHQLVIAGPPLPQSIGERLANDFEVLADFGRQNFERERATELCSRAQVGISGADALIADTGSIAIASRSQGDRLTSSLPPVHVTLALEAPALEDVAAFVKSASHSTSYCLITGPSRTADIEKTLVLGAHGPARTIIFGLPV